MLREKCLRLTTTIVLPIYPLCSRITRQNMSPCLLNIYAEYIMQNAGVNKAQAEIKTSRRNINNCRYADDTSLMAESEELKSLLMKVKGRVKKLA